MTKDKNIIQILSFSVIGVLSASTTFSSPIEELYPNLKYFNACQEVEIRESASPWSPILVSLKYGSEIKIKKLHGKYELESSDENSKENHELRKEDEAEEVDPELYTRFVWAQFELGFIPSSCLVSRQDLLNFEEVEGRVNKISGSTAKRNFSEDEKGDQTAMRGAAGNARFGKPNFSIVQDLIKKAKILNLNDGTKTKIFRQEGKLGEFK